MVRAALACLIVLFALPLAAQEAKPIFGAVALPTAGPPQPIGRYNRGCAAGLVELPETGDAWQAMRLSRNRNWGHPELVDLVQGVGRHMARIGWDGIYVGDLGAARGGPITLHGSHQIGLDADIWLRPGTDMTLSRAQRERLDFVDYSRADGAYVNDRWGRGQHELVKAAAQDPRVARIFIFPGAKVRMCDDETGDRAWLRKVRPWWGHTEHIHVRLSCPRGARDCVNQNPVPPGDGCDNAREWQRNLLNPPPPDPNAPAPTPRRELQVSDLPAQCAALLSAPPR